MSEASSSVASERVRVARELHDGLAQDLAALGFQIDQVISQSEIENSARAKLRGIRAGLSEVLDQVRNDIFRLRSDETLPAEQILQNQLQSLVANTQITIEISGQVLYNYELFRIIRELTANSVKHTTCTQITIRFSNADIEFTDNGAETEIYPAIGINGIIERVKKIDYRFEIFNSPKKFLLSKNL